MELTVLILCIALTVVSAAALIGCGLKWKNERAELRAETEKAKQPSERVIAVKQKAGEVKISYIAENAAEFTAEEEVAVADATSAAAVPAPAPDEEPAPDGVMLPVAEKLSFSERYERLPKEVKKLLDEFTAYVKKQEGCESLLQASALAYRYHKAQLAKATIRRDTVILSFPIANPELGRLVREEKLKSVRMQPAEIRLEERADLDLAKQTADISLGYLKEEEEYRAEKRKEARREAAKKKREEGSAS